MRLEPRPVPTFARSLAYPAGAIVVTLVLTGLLVLAAGANPFSVLFLVA